MYPRPVFPQKGSYGIDSYGYGANKLVLLCSLFPIFILSPAVDHLREEVFEADGVVEEYFAYDYMYVHLSNNLNCTHVVQFVCPCLLITTVVLMSLIAIVAQDFDAQRGCLR